MDGLSVFQAVVGGIQVIGKIYDAAEKLRNAPDSIKVLLTELSIMGRILEQLRPLIVDNESPLAEAAQHVKLGDLVLVFTDLAKTLSSFDKFITQMSTQAGIRGTALFKQTLWAKNEQKFQRDISRLQYHKSSLTVMLTLLDRNERDADRRALDGCRDEILRLRGELQQQTQFIRQLSPETYQQVQHGLNGSRLPSLIDNASVRTVTSNISNRMQPVDDEGASSNGPECSPGNNTSASLDLPNSVFSHPDSLVFESGRSDLDQLLLIQRPYRAAARRFSTLSFDSATTQSKGVAWSWISTFSISDISNLSLLELPLSKTELYDPELWDASADATSAHDSLSFSVPGTASPDYGILLAVNHLYEAAHGQERLLLRALQRSKDGRIRFRTWILKRAYDLQSKYIRQNQSSFAELILEDILVKCIVRGISSTEWDRITKLKKLEVMDVDTYSINRLRRRRDLNNVTIKTEVNSKYSASLSDDVNLNTQAKTLSAALDKSVQAFGTSHTITRNVLSNIGWNHLHQKKYQAAEKAFINALEWTQTHDLGDHNLLIDALLHLVANVIDLCRDEEVEKVLLLMLNLVEESDHISTLKIEMELARVFKVRERLVDAEDKILRVIHRLSEIGDSSVSGSLCPLPTDPTQLPYPIMRGHTELKSSHERHLLYDALLLYSSLGRINEAEKIFLWLVRDANNYSPSEPLNFRDPSKHSSFKHLNQVYYQLGCLWQSQFSMVNEAQTAFLAALRNTNDKSGMGSYWQHKANVGLGDCYFKHNNMSAQEARQAYMSAIKDSNLVQGDTIRTYEVAFNFGSIHKAFGDLDRAEDMFALALGGYAKLYGWAAYETMKSAEFLSDVYEKKGKQSEADMCTSEYDLKSGWSNGILAVRRARTQARGGAPTLPIYKRGDRD